MICRTSPVTAPGRAAFWSLGVQLLPLQFAIRFAKLRKDAHNTMRAHTQPHAHECSRRVLVLVSLRHSLHTTTLQYVATVPVQFELVQSSVKPVSWAVFALQHLSTAACPSEPMHSSCTRAAAQFCDSPDFEAAADFAIRHELKVGVFWTLLQSATEVSCAWTAMAAKRKTASAKRLLWTRMSGVGGDPAAGVCCVFVCVYYSWMNRKARAEGCKWKGYLCYEAGKAATCMAECPPHTMVWGACRSWCAGLEI
jgi:hypothetical protein